MIPHDVIWFMNKHFQELGSRFYKQLKEHNSRNPIETYFKNMNWIEHQQVIPTDKTRINDKLRL